MPHKLDNYLRTHRRRSGLSQDEVAFLLGTKSGTRVSRYERLAREPSLKTVFAYEVIFRAPARDLFAGSYAKVERATVQRALVLAERLASGTQDRRLAHKLAVLQQIADSVTARPEDHP